MVVGVGIEPTFQAFQTRANPSQLSDSEGGDARKLERKERFELSNRVWKTRMFPVYITSASEAQVSVTPALVVG